MTTSTTVSDDAPGEPSGLPTPDEIAKFVMADEAEKRNWLRVITEVLRLRSAESDPSDRVQFADDQLHIAACERAVRILRSDLPGEDP